MIDGFGRRITYVRMSVTDRCDLRCRYCMGESMTFLPRKDILSFEEIVELADIFIARGPKDVAEYLHDVPDDERLAVGTAGRRRVLTRHTSDHRAAELEHFVREARGESS